MNGQPRPLLSAGTPTTTEPNNCLIYDIVIVKLLCNRLTFYLAAVAYAQHIFYIWLNQLSHFNEKTATAAATLLLPHCIGPTKKYLPQGLDRF